MVRLFRSTGVLAVVIAGVAFMAHVTVSGQTAQATKTQPAITFAKDIVPIFQRSCQSCHRPQGDAPMPRPSSAPAQ